MDRPGTHPGETYNLGAESTSSFTTWLTRCAIRSWVNRETPDPAAELLRALGMREAAEGNRRQSQDVQDQLAELRNIFFGDEPAGPGAGPLARGPGQVGRACLMLRARARLLQVVIRHEGLLSVRTRASGRR